jgi:hypothetical protein
MDFSSNQKGALAEMIVETDLLNRGMNVLMPRVPARYDRLVETNGQYIRVQIKHGRIDVRDGNLRVTWETPYSPEETDLFAVFNPVNKEIYYIPVEDVPNGSKGLTVRLTQRKNRRQTNAFPAAEYLEFPA